MKTNKKSLAVSGIIFLTALCYSQTSEFSTPEGFKWGMSREEVLKLNAGQPTTSDNEKIYYLNRETKNSLLYQFTDNKLISITKKYGFDTEDDLYNDFEKYKKELINLYGTDYTKIPQRTGFMWIYKGTRIMLFDSFEDDKMKIFINYKQL